MLAGHYGVSYALKAKEKRASLGLLFLTVQFADVLWSIFILLGLEKAQVVQTLPSSRLDLYFMPITHSIAGALFWSIATYVLFRFLPAPKGARKRMIALAMAIGVVSHVLLDIPVHRPDIALFGNMYKIGLGLYNYPVIAFSLEAIVLLGGLWLYLRSTTGKTFLGKYGMIIFTIVMLLWTAVTYWGPTPNDMQVIAIFNESFYLVSAVVAAWLDGKRSPKEDVQQTAFAPSSQEVEVHV